MRSRTNRIEKSVARGIEVDPYSVKPTNLAKVYQVRRKRETLCRYFARNFVSRDNPPASRGVIRLGQSLALPESRKVV
jgi:hypothetical protein